MLDRQGTFVGHAILSTIDLLVMGGVGFVIFLGPATCGLFYIVNQAIVRGGPSGVGGNLIFWDFVDNEWGVDPIVYEHRCYCRDQSAFIFWRSALYVP